MAECKLADDLLFQHRIFGALQSGYINNAIMLAIHAAQWRTAGEFTVAMLHRIPQVLAKRVNESACFVDDKFMWPAIAALVAAAPASIEQEAVIEKLRSGDEALAKMMRTVRKMIPAVQADATYIETLKAGELQ